MQKQLNRLRELLLKYSLKTGDITLASGKKSNFYFDGKQTTLHPEGLSLVSQLFFAKIREHFPEAEAVGGPTLGADPILSGIIVESFSKNHPLFGFIVRKEPKGHGTGAWIEGISHLKPGMKVVLVEDVVTSAGSILKAAEKVREFGLDIVGAVVIVDREEGGREALAAQKIPLQSLFRKSEFIS